MVILVLAIAIFAVIAFSANAQGQDLLGVFMGKLTPKQVAQVASSAGFQDDDLLTAIAIAFAESSGDPKVVGDLGITAGGSVGLWQINLHFHPEFAGQDLTDPQTNANAAFSIYQAAGDSFSPWSTYKNGAYQARMDLAQQGVSA